MTTVGLLAIALSLALPSCSRPAEDARGVAEAFLDAHYVRIDLDGSKALCTGLALSKVEREIELTRDIAVGEDTLKPHVSYKIQREREAPTHAVYAYQLSVRPPGSDPFERVVTLTVRDQEGAWKVSNFDDGEPGGRRPSDHGIAAGASP
jgi:hypothetical protein